MLTMIGMRRVALGGALLLTLVALLPSVARGQAAPDPARWESEIRAFEAADASDPPPRGGIIFTGSSSIRLWTTLKEDFPGLPVVNRGFGGSMLPDVIAFLDRIVIPHKPALVVLYAGVNDIDAGRTPEQVGADFQTLVARIHDALPITRIAVISLGTNPARWSEVGAVRKANRTIQEIVESDPRLSYIDVFSKMLGPDGTPRPDIFGPDRLHMNRAGYEMWAGIVRPYLALRRP